MNRHFKDAQYHVTKAAQDARAGVEHEFKYVEGRVRTYTGRELEPEPTRVEQLRAELKRVERRAEAEAEHAIATARARFPSPRQAE